MPIVKLAAFATLIAVFVASEAIAQSADAPAGGGSSPAAPMQPAAPSTTLPGVTDPSTTDGTTTGSTSNPAAAPAAPNSEQQDHCQTVGTQSNTNPTADVPRLESAEPACR